MKRLLIFLLLILSLTGCFKLDDIIPDEEYGVWDGNYLYYNNYRSKSTGEDEEKIFDTICIDNKEYFIDTFYDIKHFNDKIYYLVSGSSNTNEMQCFIVIYSLEEQNISFHPLYYDLDYDSSFVVIKNDYIVVAIDANSSIRLNLNTEKLTEIHGSPLGEYGYYILKNNYLQYSNWEDVAFKKIIEIPHGYSARVDIVEIDGRNLLHIQLRDSSFSNKFDANLCFYDLDKDVLYNLIPIEENKYIDYYEKYYIVGTLNEYEYFNDGIKTEKLITNCELYELDFSDTITGNKIFEFKKDVEYRFNELDHNNVLRLSTEKVIKGNSLFNGKIKKDHAYFNIENNKMKWLYLPFNKNEEIQKEIITCGNYEYYSITKSYDGLLTDKVAVYLYSYNKETNETKLMQFYLNYESDQNETTCRYSKNLIGDDYYTFLENCLITEK